MELQQSSVSDQSVSAALQSLEIYLINLERSPERLERARDQLSGLGLSFQRIEAVDGKKLPGPPYEGVDIAGFDARNSKKIRVAEIGCYKSHIKVLDRFVHSDNEYALILEDDILPGDDLPQILGELLACAADWDMVKLEWRHSGTPTSRRKLSGDRHLVSFLTKHTGAGAYLVNKTAARCLLSSLLPMTLAYDHAFDRAWETGLRIRGVYPKPAHAGGMLSTIEDVDIRKQDWQDFRSKLKKPFYRRLREVPFHLTTEVQRLSFNLFLDGGAEAILLRLLNGEKPFFRKKKKNRNRK